MATEIRVPTLGESVTEATIGQWFRKEGEEIKADEPIVELETDKVTIEVPAPASGVLSQISVADGETVEVGAVLGSITEGDVSDTTTSAGPDPVAQKAKSGGGETDKAAEKSGGGKPAAKEDDKEAAQKSGNGGMPASPAAKKLMEEKGLSSDDVDGSGKRGQVLKEDVLAALDKTGGKAKEQDETPKEARAPSSGDDAGREERVHMTRLRQTIARRLKDAQNAAAMLTTFNEVDMTNVMALRSEYKETFEKKHGVKLGFMGFFVKAAIQALKDVPNVNAEIDGTDIIYKNYYHIGVAVGTDRGLVVPVVKDADQLSIAGIEKQIGDFGKRARDGQLKIEEMQGGTFTLSNGGVYGSLMSTPILNAPQSGILGMHKIQQRPMVVDGGIEARAMMYLALSYDHRIVDGKEAVTFLVRLKEAVEDPQRLILDL